MISYITNLHASNQAISPPTMFQTKCFMLFFSVSTVTFVRTEIALAIVTYSNGRMQCLFIVCLNTKFCDVN